MFLKDAVRKKEWITLIAEDDYFKKKDVLDLIESLQIAISELGHQVGDLKNNLNVERKRVDKLQSEIQRIEKKTDFEVWKE